MYRILTVIAVVALGALGTTVIATIVLHSSLSRQSNQIKALQGAEHSDHQKIAALENELGSASKHKKLTAAHLQCTQVPQPIWQSGLAMATPELLLSTCVTPR